MFADSLRFQHFFLIIFCKFFGFFARLFDFFCNWGSVRDGSRPEPDPIITSTLARARPEHRTIVTSFDYGRSGHRVRLKRTIIRFFFAQLNLLYLIPNKKNSSRSWSLFEVLPPFYVMISKNQNATHIIKMPIVLIKNIQNIILSPPFLIYDKTIFFLLHF